MARRDVSTRTHARRGGGMLGALIDDLDAWIFMSGYTASAMDNHQPMPGVTFLEKPFTLTRLDEAIREALRT